MKNIIDKLIEIAGEDQVKVNEPLSQHTTFRIGGPADYYVTPLDEEILLELIKYVRNNDINYYLKGNGSNLLVKDKGFRGVIIDISKLNNIDIEGNVIEASAGAFLKDIAKVALENSLGRYEFASGIPGTLGGAIRMNAGAYGGEHKNVIESVRFIDDNNEIKEITNTECNFGYRNSLFKENNYPILSAKIKLEPKESKEIKETMAELSKRRREKQPLEYPSAGSAFKRPTGYYAGTLIDEAGLKGFSVGGAQVSEKHAGFIINKDKATAKDVLDLIKAIQKTVYEKNKVKLEPEVIIIGE